MKRFCIALLVAACGVALAAPLVSGDRLQASFLVRYSGEPVNWIACASDVNAADTADFEMRDKVAGVLVTAGTVPRTGDRYVFETTIPRVGLFYARVRSCNQAGCSEWVYSDDPNAGEPTCHDGDQLVFSTLAPAGPVEF